MNRMKEPVRATSASFGNYIDPQRVLFDAPQLSLVEVDLPEYTAAGLGRALLSVMRYEFTDLGKFGVEGMSVGAETSRGTMVYEDMRPALVAASHAELHAKAPEVAAALRAKGYPPELVSIGVLRAADGRSVEELCTVIERYVERASWLESHPVEVKFANLDVLAGGRGVDWDRVLPARPNGA